MIGSRGLSLPKSSLSMGMADHLHRIESSLSFFVEVGMYLYLLRRFVKKLYFYQGCPLFAWNNVIRRPIWSLYRWWLCYFPWSPVRDSVSGFIPIHTFSQRFAVTAVQVSVNRVGNRLYDGVNACWFTALILSVAAAFNSLLGNLCPGNVRLNANVLYRLIMAACNIVRVNISSLIWMFIVFTAGLPFIVFRGGF